jgi:hypothetical protein
MSLGLSLKLRSMLWISDICHGRLPLTCDVILKALYLVYCFLSVLSIWWHVLFFYYFRININVLSCCVHAGSWLIQHGILWMDCNLGFVCIEQYLVLARCLLTKCNSYLLILQLHLLDSIRV